MRTASESQQSARKPKKRANQGNTHSFLEPSNANRLLLLALHGVIGNDTVAENVQFTLREDGSLGQEGGVWVLEGIWQEEAKDETGEDGEESHEGKEPEPSGLASHATHV